MTTNPDDWKPTYYTSCSLGTGRLLSDEDYMAFLGGDTADWSFGKRLRVKLILCLPSWRKVVKRWREDERTVHAWVYGEKK